MLLSEDSAIETEYRALIDGKLVNSSTGETMEVIDPANGNLVGIAPKCGPADIYTAVRAAVKAAPAWANISVSDRAAILRKLSRTIMSRHEELARLAKPAPFYRL